jgi:hypothetical protein
MLTALQILALRVDDVLSRCTANSQGAKTNELPKPRQVPVRAKALLLLNGARC